MTLKIAVFAPMPSARVSSASGNDSTFAGVISGSGNLTKIGPATLALSGSNTWSGILEVEGNVRAQDGVGLSPNANLKLGESGQRGMLEATGTFTRARGTGAGQVQWNADNGYIGSYNNGGFAAVGNGQAGL